MGGGKNLKKDLENGSEKRPQNERGRKSRAVWKLTEGHLPGMEYLD